MGSGTRHEHAVHRRRVPITCSAPSDTAWRDPPSVESLRSRCVAWPSSRSSARKSRAASSFRSYCRHAAGSTPGSLPCPTTTKRRPGALRLSLQPCPSPAARHEWNRLAHRHASSCCHAHLPHTPNPAVRAEVVVQQPVHAPCAWPRRARAALLRLAAQQA